MFSWKKNKGTLYNPSEYGASSDVSDSNGFLHGNSSSNLSSPMRPKAAGMRTAETVVLGPLVKVSLLKPFGIVLEENDIMNIIGGAHVFKLHPSGHAGRTGLIKEGMFITEVNGLNCRLLDFDQILDILQGLPNDKPAKVVFAMPEAKIKHILDKSAEAQQKALGAGEEFLETEGQGSALPVSRHSSTKSTLSSGGESDYSFPSPERTSESSTKSKNKRDSVKKRDVISRNLLRMSDDEMDSR